jgi:MscS family membrane protein
MTRTPTTRPIGRLRRGTVFGRAALMPLFVLLVSLAAWPALAGDGGAPTTATAQAAATTSGDEERPSEDSPRASLERFLTLCNRGEYEEAAAYLDASRVPNGSPATLARRLKAVLDRRASIDLNEISGKTGGDLQDGLSPTFEQVASVSTAAGATPVRMVHDVQSGRWIFSATTATRIDGWYDQLENRWLLDHLPDFLLRPGPLEILWWQWLVIPLVVLLSAALGTVASRIVRSVVSRVTRRTRATWDDAVVQRIGGPLVLATTTLFVLAVTPFLDLHQAAENFVVKLGKGILLADLFWILARLVDVGADVGLRSQWITNRSGSRALIPLLSRVGKVVILAFGVTTLLSELGYPVASLIAGLGLGGLAFALAAQKTVENLFGAFSIGADQPFRQGDFIRVDDFVGTVEAIGLRSTKIRTLDRTLVTIPNGSLAEKRLESYSARDRIRLACKLGLVYETSQEQMRQVLADLRALLEAHPKIWPDVVVVRFAEFGDFSLNVEIMCWFQTSDWNEFQEIREGVLLDFMGIVERAGSSFAFPTQTIHLATGGASAPVEQGGSAAP